MSHGPIETGPWLFPKDSRGGGCNQKLWTSDKGRSWQEEQPEEGRLVCLQISTYTLVSTLYIYIYKRAITCFCDVSDTDTEGVVFKELMNLCFSRSLVFFLDVWKLRTLMTDPKRCLGF